MISVAGSPSSLFNPQRFSWPVAGVIGVLSVLPVLAYTFPRYGLLLGVMVGGMVGVFLLSDWKIPWFFTFPLIFVITNLYFYALIFGVIVLAWLLWWIREAKEKTLTFPYWASLLLVLLIGSIALGRAANKSLAFVFFRYSFLFPLLGALLISSSPFRRSDVEKLITAVGLALSTLGWMSFLFGLKSGMDREILGWGIVNLAAAALAMLIPLALMRCFKRGSQLERWLNLYILIGLVMGLLASKNRAMSLALVLTLLFIAIMDRGLRPYLLFVVVLLTGTTFLVLTPRLLMLVGRGDIPDWSAVGRVEVWWNSLKILKHYGLWGMGLDSFREIYPSLFPRAFFKAPHTHNIYLQWIFDYGAIGALLLLGMVVRAFGSILANVRRLYRQGYLEEARLLLGIGASILMILIGGTMDFYLQYQVAFLFWVLIGLGLVFPRISDPIMCAQRHC